MDRQQGKLVMRVLISGHLPPPVGGIATYFEAVMASSLRERVALCFVQSSSQKRAFSESGKASLANVIWAAADCARFSKAVFSFRPDVVHIATAYGLSFLKHSLCVGIARIAGCRVLLHPHCSFSTLYAARPDWWKWMFRRVVGLSDGVLALSSEWLEAGKACPGCRVFILRNAIDLRPYQEIARARMAATSGRPPPNILYLGHLGQAKGTYLLVEAAKVMRASGLDFRFDLVGEELSPGELQALQESVIENGVEDHVVIHPPVYGQAKLDQLKKADVFVYPSYHEGTPMAVLEAMASGLPVVATRVGGLPDLVMDGRSGCLVPPGDVQGLAAALSKLIEHEELRAGMQKAGAEIAAERFDIEDHVRSLVHIYTSVLSPSIDSLEYDTPTNG